MAISLAKIEMYARREGISFLDAARRFQRKGASVRRRRAMMERRAEDADSAMRKTYWWIEANS